MKNKPLVSVIIPCYNYAKYVAEAIESVQKQSYENIELIVIDDGSTDNSLEVIKNLADKYKFKVHAQENQGIISARNKGVELAKGDYLIQLDADDFLEPTYIEETLKVAKEHEAGIVYTQAKIFGRVDFETNAPEFDIEILKHDGFMHASALVDAKVFKSRKYDEYLSDKGNEDWALYLDACLDGVKAKLLNKPLLNYRKHEDQNSRADKFEGTKKELLVRHHILSTQNAKHPKEMWYFSPYINLLKSYIDNFSMAEEAQTKAERAQRELNIYRKRITIRLENKAKKVLKAAAHKIRNPR